MWGVCFVEQRVSVKVAKRRQTCGLTFIFFLNKWIFKQMFIAKYTMVIQRFLHHKEGHVWPVVLSNTPCFLFAVGPNPETFKFGGKFLEFSLSLSFCFVIRQVCKTFLKGCTLHEITLNGSICSLLTTSWHYEMCSTGWRFSCPEGLMLKCLYMTKLINFFLFLETCLTIYARLETMLDVTTSE